MTQEEWLKKCSSDEIESDGNNTRYYLGALRDGIEYHNDYRVCPNEGTGYMDFEVAIKTVLSDGWVDDLQVEMFRKKVDPTLDWTKMTKTEFFALLNSNIPESAEPLSKDIPFYSEDGTVVTKRFTDLGMEVLEEEYAPDEV